MLILANLLAICLPMPTPMPQVQVPPERDLEALLRADDRCVSILDRAKHHRLQVLLAEPVVGADGTCTLVRSSFGESTRYFYPASSIKLCGAVALLQKLQRYNQEHGTALGLDSELVVEPRFEGDARVVGDASNVNGGRLTVRHALRKMLLVSDNQAYNHCVDFVGPDELNRQMWQAGLGSVQLWHRLSEARTRTENQQTRAVRVGDVVFAAREAPVDLSNAAFADRDLGIGYYSAGKKVDGPMSFDQKNAISLRDLQDLMVAVVRPEIDLGKRGFPGLSVAHRAFLVQALGELPSESRNPIYDPASVPDDYCKFIWRGVSRVVPPSSLRVYDKIGRAYGFTIENAYVEDHRTGRGFFLTVVVYTNPDGWLNDDRYAYAEVADPFVNAVGELVARAVFGVAATSK